LISSFDFVPAKPAGLHPSEKSRVTPKNFFAVIMSGLFEPTADTSHPGSPPVFMDYQLVSHRMNAATI